MCSCRVDYFPGDVRKLAFLTSNCTGRHCLPVASVSALADYVRQRKRQ